MVNCRIEFVINRLNTTFFRSEFSSFSPIIGTMLESNVCRTGFDELPMSAAGSKLLVWNSMKINGLSNEQ